MFTELMLYLPAAVGVKEALVALVVVLAALVAYVVIWILHGKTRERDEKVIEVVNRSTGAKFNYSVDMNSSKKVCVVIAPDGRMLVGDTLPVIGSGPGDEEEPRSGIDFTMLRDYVEGRLSKAQNDYVAENIGELADILTKLKPDSLRMRVVEDKAWKAVPEVRPAAEVKPAVEEKAVETPAAPVQAEAVPEPVKAAPLHNVTDILDVPCVEADFVVDDDIRKEVLKIISEPTFDIAVAVYAANRFGVADRFRRVFPSDDEENFIALQAVEGNLRSFSDAALMQYIRDEGRIGPLEYEEQDLVPERPLAEEQPASYGAQLAFDFSGGQDGGQRMKP